MRYSENFQGLFSCQTQEIFYAVKETRQKIHIDLPGDSLNKAMVILKEIMAADLRENPFGVQDQSPRHPRTP